MDKMRERRSETRLLCAELVEVIWRDPSGREKRRIGNLEDICTRGICVQLETPLEPGTPIRMLHDKGELAGIVRYSLYRDEGHFVGVELEGDSKWSAAEFLPEHLLHPDDLLLPPPPSRRTLLAN
jgi:hypothetical protein